MAHRRAEGDALVRGRALRSAIGIIAAGAALAGTLALIGVAGEIWRFGWSSNDSILRVERDVRARLDEMTRSLTDSAQRVAADREGIQQTVSDADSAGALFARLREIVATVGADDLAITVYSVGGTPLAWTGRPSELPAERVSGPRALFVAPGPLGSRLVSIHPVPMPAEQQAAGGAARLATVATERVLSPAIGVRRPADEDLIFHTRLGDVFLRARYEGGGAAERSDAFLVSAPDGEPLLEVEVRPGELTRARRAWRANVLAGVLGVLAIAVGLLAAPLMSLRDGASSKRRYIALSAALILVILASWTLLRFATPARWGALSWLSPATYASSAFGRLVQTPADFLLSALAMLGFVAVGGDVVERSRQRRRQWTRRSPAAFVRDQLLAGSAAGLVLVAHQWLIADTVANTTASILHFSLHHREAGRVAIQVGLLLLHAAAVWGAALALLAARARWRIARADVSWRLMTVGLWLLPAALVLLLPRPILNVQPLPVIVVPVLAAIALAQIWPRARAFYRHASQAARLLTLFLLLLLPGLAMYPTVWQLADAAKRRLIETQYATQAAGHSRELQTRLGDSLRQIDQVPDLSPLLAQLNRGASGPPQTDAAFLLWRQTDLAEFRLTSAVELYRADGALASRFALNFPEYTQSALPFQGRTGCRWDIFGEATPFGSQERRMLHAERVVCGPTGERLGAIVVHVMLDYSTLPFISSQNPYLEVFRSTASREGTAGGDVELMIYGWGRLPVYTSGGDTWPLTEGMFRRAYASRAPFWMTVSGRIRRAHVYVTNDRNGIYAVGYPALGAFDHFVNLAELSSLAGLTYVLLLFGSLLFGRLGGREVHSGQVLLHEIRGSFYRKLFLAFVAASVVPVLILAFVIRAYVATLLRGDVEAEAARTATVARRVIEEQIALERRGAESFGTPTDDVMVLISQIIDQDVNIFSGPRLVATSERDLFQSGLLPTRTPAEVYRAIVLDRLASFVDADAIGTHPYMLAATPVRLGDREAILTVPLALRVQEIEREIADLDRGVYLAAVVFILLGAAIGFSMAERIADPVNRLTRATRRIARGDFDARIAVRSADELQRLVEAFNRMAAELKAQRIELERTHRLDAWADMARQVAHEIKNPLTPVQLSAEHLQRVHQDLGRPMGDVLDACVETILTQVRLLRHIAAEFSSFASAPVARPVPFPAGELLDEVVAPYRRALANRIAIRVDAPATLPFIHADRTLAARALTNVIENALHAMPSTGSLDLQAVAEDAGVTIAVTDSGLGMDEEALARLFEPYFSTKAIGTGLGLTIVKRNIELNQGRVEVFSERGRGTTVKIWLPAVGARAVDTRAQNT